MKNAITLALVLAVSAGAGAPVLADSKADRDSDTPIATWGQQEVRLSVEDLPATAAGPMAHDMSQDKSYDGMRGHSAGYNQPHMMKTAHQRKLDEVGR